MVMAHFYCPTKLYIGADALAVLRELSVKRVLIVTDPFFVRSGKAAEIAAAFAGTEVVFFDRVVSDPPAELAAEGAALCQRLRPELLLALGGGSAMDLAKGIRYASEVPMLFAAIPTTSGSGSEVTSFSILTRDGIKEPLVAPELRPDIAILEPSLLEKLPQSLVADCGMDLLAHCAEAAVAMNRSCFTDALAIHGARIVLTSLASSYKGDLSCRLELHEAAAMAGMAFDNAGLGICHALAHAIGGRLHLPHGRLCGILLPEVIRVNSAAAMSRYAALARGCGLNVVTDQLAVRRLISAIKSLRQQLSLPGNLKQAGIDHASWKAVEQEILQAALSDPCCEANPVPVDRELLMDVLKGIAP